MFYFLGFVPLLIGIFIVTCFVKIPVRHVGQVTFLGKRIHGRFKEEGWRFLALNPFLFDVILIDIGKIPFQVIIEKALTPDNASSRIPIDIVFKPLPEKLIEYINSGGEKGVREQFSGKIQERVREWCFDEEGGPSDWMELNKSQLEGTSVLVTKIARNSITEIPDYAQNVPTWIWLRFFSKPKPKKLLKNEEYWAKNDWEAVKSVLYEIENDLGKDSVNNLINKVKDRKTEVESLRIGEETIKIEDLGVELTRLNIGDIDVLGEVAKHADQEAKEIQERKAEETELSHVITQVQKFIDLGYSREQALEAVQTERNKVSKTIQEKKINVSPETRESVEKIFGDLTKNVLDKFFK